MWLNCQPIGVVNEQLKPLNALLKDLCVGGEHMQSSGHFQDYPGFDPSCLQLVLMFTASESVKNMSLM